VKGEAADVLVIETTRIIQKSAGDATRRDVEGVAQNGSRRIVALFNASLYPHPRLVDEFLSAFD